MGIWVGVSGICTGVCYEPNSPSKCISICICSYIGNKKRAPTFNIRGKHNLLNCSWSRPGAEVPSIEIAAARAGTWSGASALNCPPAI